MAYCCVPKCKSDNKRKVPGTSFHETPSDSAPRETWLKATFLDLETLAESHRQKGLGTRCDMCYSVVCSKYFLATDYKEGCKTRKLERGATPSVFNDYPEYMQPNGKKPQSGAAVRKREAAVLCPVPTPLHQQAASSLSRNVVANSPTPGTSSQEVDTERNADVLSGGAHDEVEQCCSPTGMTTKGEVSQVDE